MRNRLFVALLSLGLLFNVKGAPSDDCLCSEWEEDGKCSRPCNSGTQRFSRKCESKPGRQCILGTQKEFRLCNTQKCESGAGLCACTPWAPGSECSVTCGEGTQNYQRVCNVAASGKPCNETEIEKRCKGPPCVEDSQNSCICTSWKELTECPSECGGTHQMKRACIHLGSTGPCDVETKEVACEACPGQTVASISTTKVDIPASQTVDGTSNIASSATSSAASSAASSATSSAASSATSSAITTSASTGGSDLGCWCSNWIPEGECSKDCGEGGKRKFSRTCTNDSNGQSCDRIEDERNCIGTKCGDVGSSSVDESEEELDCTCTDWETEDECVVDDCENSPSQNLTRFCLSDDDGVACNTTEEIRTCPGCEVKAVDPENETGIGGNATTDTGTQSGNNGTETDIITDIDEPEDDPSCICTDWETDSECTAECGNSTTASYGIQSFTRFCLDDCGNQTRNRTCYTDCEVEDKEEEKGCDCSPWITTKKCNKKCDGVQPFTRTCTGTRKNENGDECAVEVEQSCNTDCPEEPGQNKTEDEMSMDEAEIFHQCACSHWASYEECSASCGSGSRRFLRQCNKYCTGLKMKTIKVEACNTHECSEDCACTGWLKASKCSASCNGGTQQWARNCTEAVGEGLTCYELGLSPKSGQLQKGVVQVVEKRPCNAHKCPVDCTCSQFTNFGDCSSECGVGMRNRSRTCTEAQHKGKTCEELGLLENDYLVCGYECQSKFVLQPKSLQFCWVRYELAEVGFAIGKGRCNSRSRLDIEWTDNSQLMDVNTRQCLTVDQEFGSVHLDDCTVSPSKRWDIKPVQNQEIDTDYFLGRRAVNVNENHNLGSGQFAVEKGDGGFYEIKNKLSELCLNWAGDDLTVDECNAANSDDTVFNIEPVKYDPESVDLVTFSNGSDTNETVIEEEDDFTTSEQVYFYASIGAVGAAFLLIIICILWANRSRYQPVANEDDMDINDTLMNHSQSVSGSAYHLDDKVMKWQQALSDRDSNTRDERSMMGGDEYEADVHIA